MPQFWVTLACLVLGYALRVNQNDANAAYIAAGVDTEAGDRAIELMRTAVLATHNHNVLGGFGGFTGMFDATLLKNYRRPVLVSSTDGVGTKLAIAQALDKHDTIGQDLVGMVVDDIIVSGARSLFMTDYIACGRVRPEQIAIIVNGIAQACAAVDTALIGGETAEHPGLMKDDDYDLAGAAVGVVEADRILGPERVQVGDLVIAVESSGLHSNGFSLVRHIFASAGASYSALSAELGASWGEVLLEPTRLYSRGIQQLLNDPRLGSGVHALAHVTGGGIAVNLARVLPRGNWAEVDRNAWVPLPVFSVLAGLGKLRLADTESTWNLGVGFLVITAAEKGRDIAQVLTHAGMRSWPVAEVQSSTRDLTGFVQGAKGVNGGAARLVGSRW